MGKTKEKRQLARPQNQHQRFLSGMAHYFDDFAPQKVKCVK